MRKRKVQVAIFHLDEQQQKHFLLLKTNKRRGEFWQNVTGSVDEGETFHEAGLREAIEETGIEKLNIKKMTTTELFYQFHDQWDRQVRERVFVIQVNDIWDVQLDPSEHSKYRWSKGLEIKAQDFKYISNYLAVVYALETKL